MRDSSIQQDVREFYDQVGWQEISDGVYQNAQYEDLRPVSQAYINRCHQRVKRHLIPGGKYFLDAGSGPIQYPQYVSYSDAYQYRVCLDISIVALFDARKRVGEKGLFVVGDITNLPFKKDVFNGIVSLHTIHHVPPQDYKNAYGELRRVLGSGKRAVVVNGWKASRLMKFFRYPILLMERIITNQGQNQIDPAAKNTHKPEKPQGTFVEKLDAQGLRSLLSDEFPIEVQVWRSVSVRFMRALIHPLLLGRFWLWLIYILEETFPRYFGEKGQYPLITFTK